MPEACHVEDLRGERGDVHRLRLVQGESLVLAIVSTPLRLRVASPPLALEVTRRPLRVVLRR